ncbi:CLUMA_CG007641, isoform A [Clunio marinus]|uniref:CLUMA_CG007641, isoform A n=1 Tax=Clunio marinus TaxID=568069 RepID=A0A1J1I5C5_9DIPT|nr:CLUMA_CG007641, isoform A [Clunio marinus]
MVCLNIKKRHCYARHFKNDNKRIRKKVILEVRRRLRNDDELKYGKLLRLVFSLRSSILRSSLTSAHDKSFTNSFVISSETSISKALKYSKFFVINIVDLTIKRLIHQVDSKFTL